jgi:uncharacterized protein YegL
MDQSSDKNGSRLDYVKRTLIKMIEYLITIDNEIWIQIDTFSNDFKTIVEKVKLTSNIFDDLKLRINSVTTDSMTNIQLALCESNKIMETLYKENPHYKTIHLFLTDGEPTAGSTNFSTLVNLINPDYSTVFIGYGSDHNSKLLSAFSKKGIQNKYMFVDNFENTGLVYGEIVYSLLYSAIENVTIHMSEGSYIYDAVTNSWNQTLTIPVLLSEKENIYHIKSTNIENVVATIYGTICNELENNVTILSGEAK